MTAWDRLPAIVVDVDVDPDTRNYTQRALFSERTVAEAMRTRHLSSVRFDIAAPAQTPCAVEQRAGIAPPAIPAPLAPGEPIADPHNVAPPQRGRLSEPAPPAEQRWLRWARLARTWRAGR